MEITFTEDEIIATIPEEGTSSGYEGFYDSVCSEEEMKLTWMHDTRIRMFMHMELLACRDELNWIIKRPILRSH